MLALRRLVGFGLTGLLCLSIGCGGGKTEDPGTAPPAGTTYKPTGDEGTVSGKVSFNGTAPTPRKLSMDADSACAAKNQGAVSDEVVVTDGKLANVFVYVKDGSGISGKTFDSPTTPVVLDQNGCVYQPHIVALMVRQPLEVTTHDATSHNINVIPKTNQSFNETQGPNGAAIRKTFARGETQIPVKCNQHPWMRAIINVMSHPFYAVSSKDGSFQIKGLPPGTYTIAAWHEKYGEKTQSVTVGAKESKTADFAFDATSATNREYAPSSLALGETLILPAAAMKH